MTDLKQATVHIRPAKVEDVANIHVALLGIAETVGELHKMQSTPEDIRRDGFGDKPHFQVLIAEIDSEFAGMCLYFPIYSTWRGRPGAFVQDLFVVENFRGMKVGEKLLRHLARQVSGEGGVYLELAVDTGNVGAQRFYERIGMAHQADDQVHRIIGDALFAFATAKDFGDDT
ncbi:GNAT family N-acetyltransferase [Mesorhizobium sp. 1M-11]|uniref:GNAT family N-acetyltransferase n=1 Tax=Mesorhizobium sp. 1M-11 TaxID=1529006 RepID=UPI0006C73CFE|nr:GNAT family N-acetyltransferase [Mesorhizobium sp. 1M-11]